MVLAKLLIWRHLVVGTAFPRQNAANYAFLHASAFQPPKIFNYRMYISTLLSKQEDTRKVQRSQTKRRTTTTSVENFDHPMLHNLVQKLESLDTVKSRV